MGLETSTYISGLTATWPTSSDLKSQGDDHIRLIKAVLQGTFPTADKPWYFPKTEAAAGTIILDSTDQNNIIIVDTSSANVSVVLPSGFGSTEKGWTCEVVKNTNDANAAIVSPASGSIYSRVGATATIRVGILNEPTKFLWTGSVWLCYKYGPMIGSTEEYDGANLPPGYLWDGGGTYSSTDFAELYAVLGSTTLKDKRGRVSAGKNILGGGSAGLLTSSYFGADGDTLGAVGGSQSHQLVLAKLPSGNLSFSLTAAAQVFASAGSTYFGNVGTDGFTRNAYLANSVGAGGQQTPFSANSPSLTASNVSGTVSLGGSDQPHAIVQPTITVNKIKRAC